MRPPVVYGDKVTLRNMKNPGDVEIIAYIHDVKRKDKLLTFHFGEFNPGTEAWRVSFHMNRLPFNEMKKALEVLGDSASFRMVTKGNLVNLDQLPNPPKVEKQRSKRKIVVEFKDPNLNREQKGAIQAVIDRTFNDRSLFPASGKQSFMPHVIEGAPGSGKTKTAAELVYQIIQIFGESVVLCTAPSNPAADVLALRLIKYFDQKQLLRMNGAILISFFFSFYCLLKIK